MTEIPPIGEDEARALRLLDELRRVVGATDPIPDEVRLAARSAIAYRRLDDELAELAELSFDSLVESGGLAGVRSVDAPRLVGFAGDTLTVELQVAAEDDRRRLVGQLVPGSAGLVEVRHVGGSVEVEADELGRFDADVPAGPVSLRCSVAGGTVTTEWLVV